ncbi:MAG: ribonuclease HII [Candidatus Omnitrophota bacterium]|jgi:ribonuclease HII
MANFALERRLKKQGFDVIIGVDEVGRGPLAGPLVAAATCLKTTRFNNRIDDSKRLTRSQREDAFLEIIQKSIFSLSVVDERMIDTLNILTATRLCMENAIYSLLRKLGYQKICIMVDGNVKLNIPDYPVFNIIKGDVKSKTIACASILAKVNRDRIMSLYDQLWPEYGFLRHNGYPTNFHRLALKQFGPCPIHRLSFSYA